MQPMQQYKDLIIPVLKRFNIRRAAIFGSIAKHTETAQSDIDILIEAGNGFTLFDALKLESELSEITNRRIDIVEFSAIKPSLEKEILRTAISIL